MNQDGPDLEALTRRLVRTPEPFLAEPGADVDVEAVVADAVARLRGEHIADQTPLATTVRNELRLILIGAWVVADPWFVDRAPRFADPALSWLTTGLSEVARIVDASRFVADADRREELVRRGLDALGLRPRGESEAQAADRLRTLDSVERRRVMAATKQRQKRAREVRAALRQKAAEEAAAKVSRE